MNRAMTVVVMVAAVCTVGQAADPCDPCEAVYTLHHGTVVVDGDLGEWEHATWYELDQLYYGEVNDVVEAKFAVQWNDATDKVYAAVMVHDL